MTPWHLTWSDIERSKVKVTQISVQSQGHPNFKALDLVKEQSCPMLLLNINRKRYKPYMGSPMTPSYLTWSDPERSKSRSPIW